MADTTRVYPQYPRSNFPEQVDDFPTMQDPSAYQMTIVRQYETLAANGDVEGAAALLKQYPDLDKSLFNAQKFNYLSDGIKAAQQFFKDDVEAYVAGLFQNTVGIDDNAEGAAKSTNAYSAYKTDILINHCIEITLPASRWSDTAPYKQKVDVKGIRTYHTPFISVDSNQSRSEQKAQKKQFSKHIDRAITYDGSIEFECEVSKPAIDLKLTLKGGEF